MRQQKDTNTYQQTYGHEHARNREEERAYIPESQYFSFIVSRTEKLASAVYMVTNLITDTEPIKHTLRERSVMLLTYVSGSRTYTVSERMTGALKTADAITEIISLLHVARAGNLISDMNYRVLQEEYAALQQFIEQTKGVQTDAEEFVETLFAKQESPELHAGDNQKDIYKGHNAHKNVLYNLTDTKKTAYRNAQSNGHTQPTAPSVSAAPKKTKQANEAVKRERRETIVALVKKRGAVNVKDIAAHITGCSEKTVQRELLALVKDNVLIKEGEKRWSTYRLKKTRT